MSRIFSGAGIAVCAFAAATAVSAGSAPQSHGLNQIFSLIDAVASNEAAYDYAIEENENADLLRVTDARPTDSLLAHESDAAALYSGRNFFALGKERNARAEFARIAADATETPNGWRRERSGADDRLVHEESGLQCPLEYDVSLNEARRALALKGVTKYDERGRDVSCNYAIEGQTSITVYASFYPDVSLEDHAAAAAAAIARSFTFKGDLPVITVKLKDASGDNIETPSSPSAAGAFDVGEINGVPYKTAIWLGVTHGWHVKTRATYPQSDMISEITAAILFQTNFLNVDKKNRADPTADGAEV